MKAKAIVVYGILFAICAYPSLCAAQATPPEKPPLTRLALMESISYRAKIDKEIIERIEKRGVDFEVTPDIEQELVAIGATPGIIKAIKDNYRPAESAPEGPDSVSADKPPDQAQENAFRNPPADFEFILMLLEEGIEKQALMTLIKRDGVDFLLTDESVKALRKAGASDLHLEAIRNNFRRPRTSENAPDRGQPETKAKPDPYIFPAPPPTAAERRAARIVTAPPEFDLKISGIWEVSGTLSDPSDPRKTLQVAFTLKLRAEKVTEDYARVTGELVEDESTYPLQFSEWRHGRQLSIFLEKERISITGTLQAGKLSGIISMPVDGSSWKGKWEAKRTQTSDRFQ